MTAPETEAVDWPETLVLLPFYAGEIVLYMQDSFHPAHEYPSYDPYEIDMPGEYRRADLPPTLAEALAVPEVAALVQAAYKEGYSCGYHTGNPHKNIHADWEASKARAALAAIDPGPLT
jgi:hypothetical protein